VYEGDDVRRHAGEEAKQDAGGRPHRRVPVGPIIVKVVGEMRRALGSVAVTDAGRRQGRYEPHPERFEPDNQRYRCGAQCRHRPRDVSP